MVQWDRQGRPVLRGQMEIQVLRVQRVLVAELPALKDL